MFESQALDQNGSQSPKAFGTPFAKGNQNPNMPDRRPEFANSTLIDAAGTIINATPSALHADDVTRAVFIINDRDGFTLAKHSMASELYRGAKKELWKALGENRYRRK
tara:strand:+ start:732 stop:1055 length:324 start_codon:yes stop_codon:yes gene_type:complete